MTFNKKVLAGLVAFATAGAANATIVVGGDNGFEFSVDGEINQFYVYSDDNTDGGDSISEVRDGLLPAFLGFNIKAPTTNGLDIAARVSISPSTNGFSYGDAMEQREAFFTVGGGFGEVLMGKALGLYGSHNILTDQTLFGVGYGTRDNRETTLGRIGLGYDYADWRSQIKYTTPSFGGFKAAFAIMDSTSSAIQILEGTHLGSIGSNSDNEDLRFEGDLSYAGTFGDSGAFSAWLSAMSEDRDNLAQDAQAWTIGGTLNVAGFEFMAQYSDSEDATSGSAANSVLNADGSITTSAAVASVDAEWEQFIIQGGYNFGGSTRVVAGYSENENTSGNHDVNDGNTLEMITIGVYHDVTANLKLVAEYSQVENDLKGDLEVDQDIFSVGGFVSW